MPIATNKIFTMPRIFEAIIFLLIFFNIEKLGRSQMQVLATASSSQVSRSMVSSISEQLGFGAKRTVYYLNTLLESCDNVDDLNNWILFMDSYLTCDAQAEPRKRLQKYKAESSKRLGELCAAWPRKRKCSSRLAVKLDSCLGPRLEDGRAGTSALRLADAHMKFICHHQVEYTRNLQPFGGFGELLPVEKRALKCYSEMEDSLKECVREKELSRPLSTFCQKFGLAKECLLESSSNCKHQSSQDFLRTMLGQLEFDLKCATRAIP